MTLSKKDLISIARAKLPLVVEAMTQANLEAQKTDPDLKKLQDLLASDELDGLYDVCDLLSAYLKLERAAKEGKQ